MVVIVHDTSSHDYTPTYQISLTYLKRQFKLGPLVTLPAPSIVERVRVEVPIVIMRKYLKRRCRGKLFSNSKKSMFCIGDKNLGTRPGE